MARKANTIKATPGDLSIIRGRMSALGWSTTQDSQALKEVSKYLLCERQFIPPSYKILLTAFRKLEGVKFYVVSGKNFLYSERMDILKKESFITSCDVEDLISDEIIRAKNISYKTWQKFYTGEFLEKTTFIKFWEGIAHCLDIDLNMCEIEALRDDVHESEANKFLKNNLFRSLLTFDHGEKLDIFRSEISYNRRIGIFWIQGNCSYSRIWLMRCLEAEFRQTYGNEIHHINFDFNSELVALNIKEILPTIECRIRGEKNETIGFNNFVIVFNNIDSLNRTRFGNFISHVCNPLSEKVSTNQGYLLLFLVDSGLQNDWRNHTESITSVISVPAVENFLVDDIKSGLLKASSQIRRAMSMHDAERWASQIFSDSDQGTPKLVLQEIYKLFNYPFNREAQWRSYPNQ